MKREAGRLGLQRGTCLPNGLRVSGAALIDGYYIGAETDAENRPIALDAPRRPLHARVGRAR